MKIRLQIPEMDMSGKILVFLSIYINCVSAGLDIPQPDKLVVNILDGEVIVHWKHPVGAPSNSRYNVQMAKYSGDWAVVASCTGITNTYCNLSGLLHDYRAGYKVKVQLVSGHNTSVWATKKFLPNKSELQPPSFTLMATSSTLTVYVHQKPILRKLFPYGLTYTIYLEEKDNKTTTAYLRDGIGEDRRTFTSLHWGRKYCVSIKAEGNGALSVSSVSPKQCLQLPEQKWFVIAVSSLTILGVLAVVAIMATILLCYLRGPEKTPVALKPPESSWLPLSIGEGPVEVVTDKGWFLSRDRTEVKNCVNLPCVTVTEDDEEEGRSTSVNSGVGVMSSSASNSRGSPPMRQEDSGCGSLGGPESSTGSQADYPLQEETTDPGTARKREDSGVGLSCSLDTSSVILDAQDGGSLKESVAGGNYRSQSPSAVQIHACDDEEAFKQVLPDSVLAEVITGYRAAPQSCICSGAGQCTWCHRQGQCGPEVIKQYRATCIENGLESTKSDFVDSYKRALTFSSYPTKTQMDTVIMDDFERTCFQMGETFPLLTALSPQPLVERGRDFNMNTVLSLSDVELKSD